MGGWENNGETDSWDLRWPSIIAQAGFFLVVFLVLHTPAGLGRERALAMTSLTHNVIASALGLYAIHSYFDSLGASALARSRNFPWADYLQRFNAGFFPYDLWHCIISRHTSIVVIVHNFLVLAALGLTIQSGFSALGNAVNTSITDIGSLFYTAYLSFQSKKNYARFVIIYSVSRLVFFAWSLHILYQLWNREALFPNEYPFWLPVCVAALQMLLLFLNWPFLYVHIRKLLEQRREDSKSHVEFPLE